jgi:hypothetical protein
MTELLKSEDRTLLIDELKKAILTVEALQSWLRAHYTVALAELGAGNLRNELTNLTVWAEGEDGMRALLQKLADHPPSAAIPYMIYAYTHGQIKPQEKTNSGLPPVSPDKSWFAANRPFVNRDPLRDHLRELENSAGAESVLVIDGDPRTGKSFAVSLALGFDIARKSQIPLDIDDFARVGQQMDARDLAVLIAGGDEVGCPLFDETKEDEAVPRLLYWLTSKLKGKSQWIIIDHCNRRVLTRGARTLLGDLIARLRSGALPDVRLILVDFDLKALPDEWRESVRHDCARLPDQHCVAEWCAQLASAAQRQCPADAPEQWARNVFSGLDTHSRSDGSWHRELERQLRQVVKEIMACEHQP